ncbi:GH116 family glycosyl hydrolase [Saccharopolyspora sp. CA-218241]|uniref:GH116 family glycosyl hydrolase n=1 Tax=Saccharopolyspora sp. CA-218241 TaxID=3240027 RepID=UPI003D9511F7
MPAEHPHHDALPEHWWRSLSERGTGSALRAADAAFVGMPVGGIGCGQLYLGAGGRPWLWDVDNRRPPGNVQDAHYLDPLTPSSPFDHAVAVRTGGQDRWLDERDVPDAVFAGRPPLAEVDYGGEPVRIALRACSPFVPGEVEDSSYPAVVLEYTATNDGTEPADVVLAAFLENPVCLDSRQRRPMRLHAGEFRAGGARGVQFSATEPPRAGHSRPDIVVEDWDEETDRGWTATGDAFGDGPVRLVDRPDYQGESGAFGQRMVDSHASAPGSDAPARDRATGTLRSAPFRLDRDYLRFRLSGGFFPGTCCLNLLVDGAVVGTATGSSRDQLADRVLHVAPWAGREAVIELVDAETGSWGHVGAGRIVLSDHAPSGPPLAELPDHGTVALAASGADRISTTPALAAWDTPSAVLDARPAEVEPDGVRDRSAGAVRAELRLAPGEQRTVRFHLAWSFPVPDREGLGFLTGAAGLRRHYAERFDVAADVVRELVLRAEPLIRRTAEWVRTWYEDSTLPWWLLERVAAGTTILATSTCYRFAGGRFYGWEGAYCCAGTCTHVWHYAHAVAGLFPDVERDTRERVDLGIGFHQLTGQVSMRGEADRGPAVDGQAGTVLRIYREHRMSADDGWLHRMWPRTRQAVEHLMRHDAGADGVLDGPQPNTQDATWFGRISWLSGLYVAALRAGEAMARECGDADFAARCAELAERGTEVLGGQLFNGEYYVHELDPARPGSVNTNRGCFADQLLGQSWAEQLDLPRVFPAAQTRIALESIWRHNFVPRPLEFREASPIPGGRTFYDADVPALVMCTWPRGGGEEAGANWSTSYLNEAWHGIEYQVAAHLIAEGMVTEGLAVARSVHDRYDASRRNPYNEIECSDHYARSMASFGVYLGALGFEHHGPRGHLGFAPKIRPEDFAAAFTTAAGWGRYAQVRGARRRSEIDLRHGRLRLASLALDVAAAPTEVALDGAPVPHESQVAADRVLIRFPEALHLEEGQRLVVEF